MAQNTHPLQAPQTSQLSDRVTEDTDMRERDSEGQRERDGRKVELDVLAHRG